MWLLHAGETWPGIASLFLSASLLGKFKICHEQLINQNEYIFLTQFLGCYVSITLPDVSFGEIILDQLCRY